MNLKPIIKQRFHQTWRLYVAIFLPMWCMFILNNTVLFGSWNTFGVDPRDFEIASFVGVLFSWTMHASVAHIVGNSLLLAQVLLLFGAFEKNAFKVISLLIIGSGIATWILGTNDSNHIGASGLAFAMLGFMVGSALFAKRLVYMVACILLGTGFWFAVGQGLVPKQGISFAGHFGGLIVGIMMGSSSNIEQSKQLSSIEAYRNSNMK